MRTPRSPSLGTAPFHAPELMVHGEQLPLTWKQLQPHFCPCPHPVSKPEWSGSVLAHSGAPALNPSPFGALPKAEAGDADGAGVFLGRLLYGSSTWKGEFGKLHVPCLAALGFGQDPTSLSSLEESLGGAEVALEIGGFLTASLTTI